MGDFSDFTDLVPWMLGSSRKIRPAPKPFLRLEQPSRYSPSVALSLTPSPDDPRPRKRPPSPKNVDRIRPTSAPVIQSEPAPESASQAQVFSIEPAPESEPQAQIFSIESAPESASQAQVFSIEPAPELAPQAQVFSIESALFAEPPPEPVLESQLDDLARGDWHSRAPAPLPEGIIFNLPSDIRPIREHSRRRHPHLDDLEPYVHKHAAAP